MTPREAFSGWRRFLLCLAVTTLLWVALAAERSGELAFTVPVEVVGVPRGLKVVSEVPKTVKLRVSGPRIALFRQECRGVLCRLDLSDLAAGTAVFPSVEQNLGLDRELKITRISPASLSLTLAPTDR